MRTLYTASVTHVDDIPPDADIVAGGPHWTKDDYAKFPHALHLQIARTDSEWWKDIIDIESGMATLQQARRFLIKHQAAGFGWGMAYYWIGHRDAVETALSGLYYHKFIANQTGEIHVVPGSVATQWCGTAAGNSPGPYDVAVVSDDRWYKTYR